MTARNWRKNNMSTTNNNLVCIKRPEPGISAVFEDMYLNERLVDVTLSCCDGQLQAHKLVLAASSTYFSSLFDKLANPFHYPVIVIKDMRMEDLKLIVDFMYRGQLTVSQERLVSLIKSAENLQITGLTNTNGNGLILDQPNGTNISCNVSNPSFSQHQRFKRSKKSLSTSSSSSTSNNHHHQALLNNNRNNGCNTHDEDMGSPQPERLLEQSMITGESMDDSHPSHLQFSAYANNDTATTRNLNNSNQNLHTPSPSSIHVSHLSITAATSTPEQQQISNQLQVLSHSLTANRSSLGSHSSIVGSSGSSNHHHHHHSHQQGNSQMQHQQSRGRVHPCNICWKTFREKANLKRHLQVHSLDRIMYACPDCNKTFSWKDNYIRHTKTAHHMNNARPQV